MISLGNGAQDYYSADASSRKLVSPPPPEKNYARHRASRNFWAPPSPPTPHFSRRATALVN